jgi:hypothetical protein
MGNQYALGFRHTDETKAILADRSRGNSYAKGRVMPGYEKLQRSKALKGRPKSEAWKIKAREAALLRWAREREKDELRKALLYSDHPTV